MANILVVEDKAPNRRQLVKTLVRLGHEVVEAQNAEEAVQSALPGSTDLVFMDIGIPVERGGQCDERGGLVATREITGGSSSDGIPVVAITGSGDENLSREEILAAGCVEIIIKPITRNGLVAIIEAVLARRAQP